jgi:Tol biopolymer transport system component
MRLSITMPTLAALLVGGLLAAIAPQTAESQGSRSPASPDSGARAAVKDSTKTSRLQELIKEAEARRARGDLSIPGKVPPPPLPPGVVRITNSSGGETQPAWSADGKVLYYVYTEGKSVTIRRHDLATGVVESISNPNSLPQQLDVSPDGAYIVYSGMMELGVKLYVMRLADRETARLCPGTTELRETYPRYSRTGMKIYYGTSRPGSALGLPMVVNRDGENPHSCFEEEGLHTRPAVSWSGDKVAWNWHRGPESKIRIMDANITSIFEDYQIPGYLVASLEWVPGDQSLLVSVVPESNPLQGFDIVRFDLATQTMTPVLDLGDNELDMRFSPDGKRLALVSRREGQDEIFVYTLQP